jgi:hypothetical protein
MEEPCGYVSFTESMAASYPDKNFGDFLHSTRLEEIMNDFSLHTETKSASN